MPKLTETFQGVGDTGLTNQVIVRDILAYHVKKIFSNPLHGTTKKFKIFVEEHPNNILSIYVTPEKYPEVVNSINFKDAVVSLIDTMNQYRFVGKRLMRQLKPSYPLSGLGLFNGTWAITPEDDPYRALELKLVLEGNKQSFTLEDLSQTPHSKVEHTLECKRSKGCLKWNASVDYSYIGDAEQTSLGRAIVLSTRNSIIKAYQQKTKKSSGAGSGFETYN